MPDSDWEVANLSKIDWFYKSRKDFNKQWLSYQKAYIDTLNDEALSFK